MFKALVNKIASQYIADNFPQQPLRLQPDYGDRNAADFLGDRNVSRNTGYGEKLKAGPGNAFDEIVADNAVQVGTGYDGELEADLEADFMADDFMAELEAEFMADNAVQVGTGYDGGLEADLEADELEGFEIVDDMGLDRMSDFLKESRFSKGEKGREEFENWMNEEGREELKEEWESNTEKYKDVVKDLAEERSEKSADEIIDDMGLGRMADDHNRGSYMSRQNLREMSDMADFIVDDIGMEGLDDWVEDKISQSYSAMSDVARYRGYRDDHHQHGEGSTQAGGFEGEHFRYANDEIIDDLEW